MNNIFPELIMLIIISSTLCTIIFWFTIADSRKNKKEKINREKYLELQSYFEQIKAASTEEEINLISEKVFVQHSKAIICNPKLKLILVDLEEMLIAKRSSQKNRCTVCLNLVTKKIIGLLHLDFH